MAFVATRLRPNRAVGRLDASQQASGQLLLMEETTDLGVDLVLADRNTPQALGEPERVVDDYDTTHLPIRLPAQQESPEGHDPVVDGALLHRRVSPAPQLTPHLVILDDEDATMFLHPLSNELTDLVETFTTHVVPFHSRFYSARSLGSNSAPETMLHNIHHNRHDVNHF